LTPLRHVAEPLRALAEVANGNVPVAVLPYPSAAETWWIGLGTQTPRLHIIARLPFWAPRPPTLPDAQAVVVAATTADASEADRSLLSLVRPINLERPQIERAVAAAGFDEMRVSIAASGGCGEHVLVEVSGAVTEGDERLNRLAPALSQPQVLGHYAVPIGTLPGGTLPGGTLASGAMS
jgi:chorismate mutase/prephenate dehydratase